MEITQSTFKAKVNNDFSVEITIGPNTRGEEAVTLKLRPSRDFAPTRMSIPEFDQFLDDLKAIVHANTKAGREVTQVDEKNYNID